ARITGHLDKVPEALADHLDAIHCVLSEVLGNPALTVASAPVAKPGSHPLAMPMSSSVSSLPYDVVTPHAPVRPDGVPELVLETPDATRPMFNHLPRELIRGPELAEQAFTLIDDESTRPYVRELRRAHGHQSQHVVRLHRPPRRGPRQWFERVPTTRC